MLRKRTWLAFCVLAVSGVAFARNADRETRIDALASAPVRAARELSSAERSLLQSGKEIQYEERLGVPTFIWAAPSSEREARARLARRGDPAGEARLHLAAYASFYGLEKGDVASAKVVDVHDIGTGPIIVRFEQEIGGIEVFREELSVMMDRNLERIALSGYLSRAANQTEKTGEAFRLDEREAVALALADRTGRDVSAKDLRTIGEKQGPYGFLTRRTRLRGDGEGEGWLSEPARYKPVYFHGADGLEPGWYVEVSAELTDDEGNIDSDMYAYVVSARDGRILFRHDLTVSDNFSYRVFADTTVLDQPMDSPQGNSGTPHPTGNNDSFVAPFVSPNLLNLQNVPGTISDPWLPPGATETNGNNVDAFANLFAPDGFSAGDFRADITAPGIFDRVYDTTLPPNVSVNQQKAAVTNLFYVNNFLHDWYYVAGFNEVGRNAQKLNFGRGGVEGDDIRAQAQDFSGTNNANMSTPADGGRPRMRMYVFSGPSARHIDINSQPSGGTLLATYPATRTNISATFGAQSFDNTADIVRAIPNDGCGPTNGGITNGADIAGKIAFIDRGGACTGGFAQKTKNAQNVGAIGVIIANISTSASRTVAPGMGGADATIAIGAMSLNFADGEDFRNTLALGTVNGRLFRFTGINRDGDLDNQVIEHEWTHYLSNRLVGNAAGLSNQQGGGMGEGWSDFNAQILTVRPEDITVPANANWSGVYTTGAYAAIALSSNSSYFGIRRVPYSTDMTKDPLTFKHIQDGVALPCGTVPIDFGCDGSSNSEVHNVGEVWATMLWECFASLLNNHPFDVARDRMRNYLVASLKMTPNAPTILEARDAMLAAAFATDPNDFARFCAAFAKRGAGQHAVGPDRTSTTLVGVTESFVCGNDLAFVSANLGAPTVSCDGDAYLDDFETAPLTVTLKNVGVSALTHTTATVTSSNPSIHFANGGVMTFPPSAPFQTTTASIDVSMFGAAGIQDFSLDISFTDPAIPFPPGTASLLARGNADDLLNASASDNVEASVTAWTLGGFGGSWQRVRDTITPNPNNFVWNGPDPNNTADLYLISPTLNVASTGNFSFTFKHRFMFENPTSFFDGGVVEISTDGGGTWADVGAANLSPTYNHTLVSGGTNPLNGRLAYAGTSAGYPAFATVTCSLGTAFAGQAVRIRFRVGSDSDTGPRGWDIDDISFSNITNTPFTLIVPQPPNPAHELGALSPAKVWIGLKNSDDVGTNFDLKAEVFLNGFLVGSNEVDGVSGGSSGFNNAVQRAISLALSSPGTNGICSGATLSIRLSVRAGGTGHRSGTARLWFNDSAANSRFDVTIGGVSTDLYLRDGFVLAPSPAPVSSTSKKTIDVFVDRLVGGNPFKPFGTWSKTF